MAPVLYYEVTTDLGVCLLLGLVSEPLDELENVRRLHSGWISRDPRKCLFRLKSFHLSQSEPKFFNPAFGTGNVEKYFPELCDKFAVLTHF